MLCDRVVVHTSARSEFEKMKIDLEMALFSLMSMGGDCPKLLPCTKLSID